MKKKFSGLLIIPLILFSVSFSVWAEDEDNDVTVKDEELSIDEATLKIVDDPFADTDTSTTTDDTDSDKDSDSDTDTDDETDEDTVVNIDDPFAEDSDDEDIALFDDLDSMFETDSMVDEVDEEEASTDVSAADEFLVSEGVEFGGTFDGSLLSYFSYDYPWTSDFDITDPSQSFVPSVEADLFFDARPESDYRVFGKLGFTSASGTESELSSLIPDSGLTFSTSTDDDGNVSLTSVDEDDVDENDSSQTTVTSDDLESSDDTVTEINITIKELFVDFDWNDKVYFRFGKSMIQWGVGYFWSPADVLNVESIDIEDPTADREGPINFKIHYPFGINNAYLYIITEDVTEPLDTAIAPKVEFVIGKTEIGIGGYYQRESAPKIMTTVSSSIKDFDIFGEGVVSWGSDRVFVRASKDQSAATEDSDDDLETVLDTFKIDDEVFFSATIGANYTHELDNDNGTLLAVGQYFFNGEGYDDSSLLADAYYLSQNSSANGLALEDDDQPEGYEDPDDLSTNDISNWGKHYIGFFFSWSSIMDSKFSFSALSITNLNDLSGMVMPTVNFEIMDYLSIDAGLTITYGDAGDEYTNTLALYGLNDDWDGPTVTFTLGCNIGVGSF